MRTLVTGGGGFLGQAIVEQLIARGDEVTIFARGDYPALIANGVTLIRGDIADPEALNKACGGMESVFQVAARAGIWGTWDSFYQPNVRGTENVIAACKRNRVPALIFTSSPSVVFDGSNQSGANESLPYPERYENFYSHTKALAEQKIIAANSPELMTVAIRPHLIFGPGDPHLLPRLIRRAYRGRLRQVGDGANRVDLTFVEDAARAHVLAADALHRSGPLTTGQNSIVAGSVYFISQDEPVNLWDWINTLLERLQIRPVSRTISLPAARRLGKALEFVHRTLSLSAEPAMTRFLANALALDHYYDISRAKQQLGYQPRYTMTAATERTIQALQSAPCV